MLIKRPEPMGRRKFLRDFVLGEEGTLARLAALK